MSNLAETIKISYENILKVYKEVANMLQDADNLMEMEGYSIIGGNSINASISRSILYPTYWLYPYVSRFYMIEEVPLELKALSVNFIDHNRKPVSPIVLVGLFQYLAKDDGTANYHWETLQEAWFINIEDQVMEKNHNTAGGLEDVVKGIIRATNIELIQNPKDLEDYVINPLLSMEF
jgi:hypothetical protein